MLHTKPQDHWSIGSGLKRFYHTGNKLEGAGNLDLGEVVSLQEQTSPYFQLREMSKCIL